MDYLTVDIGGTALKSVQFGDGDNIVRREERPSCGKAGGEALMQAVFGLIQDHRGFGGIGVSCSGQIDTATGRVIYGNDNIPHFTGTPVGALLRERFHVPVTVDNDVNAMAMGEAHYGAATGEPDFLCLTYGTGIGGAIVVGGGVYGGQHGVAGEFGHIVAHPGGRLCACGGRGCYEQYASTTALIKLGARIDPAIDSGRAFFARLPANPALEQALDQWIQEVAYGLVTLAHIFNPSLLVLGGGVLEQRAVLDKLRLCVQRQVMGSFQPLRMLAAQLGNLAGAYGALYRIRREMEGGGGRKSC